MKSALSPLALGLAIAFMTCSAAPAQTSVNTPMHWDGWYAGLSVGKAWGEFDTSLEALNLSGFFNPGNIAGVNSVGASTFSTSGTFASVQIGRLQQRGGWVIGAEISIGWSSGEGQRVANGIYPLSLPGPGQPFSFQKSVRSDWMAVVLGRLGPDMGRWYPYVTGGLAAARIRFDSAFEDPTFLIGCPNCTAQFNEIKLGLAVGGGVEWAITNRWLLRSEYLFIEFQQINGSSPVFANPNAPGATARFDHNAKLMEHLARLSVAYKF